MRERFSLYLFAALLLFCASFAHGQMLRWDLGAPGSSGAATISGSGLPFLIAQPGVTLNFCNHPANASPCTNFATTYTSSTGATPCPNNAQIVLQGSSTCQATSDNFGNLGVWAAVNTACGGVSCYDYTLTVNGVSTIPYTITLGASTGGSVPAAATILGSTGSTFINQFAGTIKQGNTIGWNGSSFIAHPEIHSADFISPDLFSVASACPTSPVPCQNILDALSGTIPVANLQANYPVVIGSSTQSVLDENRGVVLQCTSTNGGDCIDIGQNGKLTCAGPGNTSSGCFIGSTSGFIGTSLVANSVKTGAQTAFVMSGHELAPAGGATITCGIFCGTAIEGNTDIRNTNIQGIANTIDWVFQDATSGSAADNNNVLLDNSKAYCAGKPGCESYAVFGGAAGSADGFYFTNLNGGDGCMGVFDGVTMCGVTMTEKVTVASNVVTLNAGSTYNFNTVHTGELFWINGVAYTVCGPSYLGCSSGALDPSPTTLYVTPTPPATSSGSAHWGCVGGFGCLVNFNGAGGRGTTINNIHIGNSYIEGATGQQSGSEYMAVQNVRDLEAPNLAFNVGPAVTDCVGIYHTVNNNQGRVHVAGRINGGHHCNEVINNHVTGNIFFLDSASQWDFDYTYPGEQSGIGEVIDGILTLGGALAWTNGSGVDDLGISRDPSVAGQLDIGTSSTTGDASGTLKATGATFTGLGTSSSPVCPNGTGGALTLSGCTSGGANITVANASSTGTTAFTLTKLTGGKAVIMATTDTSGIVGITISGAGTTGSATIQTSGLVSCVFDGATTANDTVVISSTTLGNCHDSGTALAGGTGIVLSTNGSAGTYQIVLNLQPGGNDGFDQDVNFAACTTSSNACSVAVTWPNPGGNTFPDSTVFITCEPVGLVTSVVGHYLTSVTASGFTWNESALGLNAQGGYTTASCHGHHK
jgi:hypothetical protein